MNSQYSHTLPLGMTTNQQTVGLKGSGEMFFLTLLHPRDINNR